MKSYIITETQSDKHSSFHTVGTPSFVFTSLKKAMQQMEVLKHEIAHGRWFYRKPDEPADYKLDWAGCDEYWDKNEHPYRIVVTFPNNPNKVIVYDLWAKETNSGYMLNK